MTDPHALADQLQRHGLRVDPADLHDVFAHVALGARLIEALESRAAP